MQLLTSQKNLLYEIIESNGLSPFQFNIEEYKFPTSGMINTKLLYKGTNYYFDFMTFQGHNNMAFAEFSPGEFSVKWRSDGESWNILVNYFFSWLLYLRREITSLDKWARLQREMEELGVNLSQEGDGNQFTVEEYFFLEKKIISIKNSIGHIGLSELQINEINNKLDHLIQLAESMNKFDWKSLFIGTIISIIIQLEVSPDHAKSLWQIIKSVFNTYFLP